ncbi:hypothetical protein FRC07_012179, partial [Ceratobasidium sp. 392]
MFERIKRRVDGVKDRLYRLTQSLERTAPTTEPAGASSPESERGSKNAAWPGLKALMIVLSKGADGFPPLKSVMGVFWESLEIFE